MAVLGMPCLQLRVESLRILAEIGGVADSPRLAELRRQRALIQGHLTWLDAEIAAEELRSPSAREPTPNTPAVTIAPSPQTPPIAMSGAANVSLEAAGALAESADAHAEEIMGEYRKPANDLRQDVRTGCFLYFAAGLLLFFAAVVGLYFALRH